jgi:uncharacterized protein YdeI (YjbR/CyaY-like superfamily)
LIREKAKPLRWHYDPTREEKVPEASRHRSAIKKQIAELPISIKNLLLAESLYEAYQARPFYQRNDYIHWIMGAKREDTAQKRIAQMIRELRAGNLYMIMEYRK